MVSQEARHAPRPTDLGTFAEEVAQFARTDYLAALRKFPTTDTATVEKLSEYTGIDKTTLLAWSLDIASYDSRGNSLFLTTLLKSKGLALGEYDGRVTAIGTGIAGKIDPNSGGNDPTMTAVTGVYTTMWNVYLNEQLKYTSNSSFTDLNDRAFKYWDFSHIDPTGAQKGVDSKGNVILYTAGDRRRDGAQSRSEGAVGERLLRFRDAVLSDRARSAANAVAQPAGPAEPVGALYPSGHMVYLDGGSRTALKADLAKMYDTTVSNAPALLRIRALQARVPK